MRMTDNVLAILGQMLGTPERPWYGLELAKAAEIGSATIYAALTRMERAGLVEASWEQQDPSALGRPQRRLYRLTPNGVQVGTEAIANYSPRIVVRPVRAAGAAWAPDLSGGSI